MGPPHYLCPLSGCALVLLYTVWFMPCCGHAPELGAGVAVPIPGRGREPHLRPHQSCC